MASTTAIHLVGGPADGTSITVELDVNGRPPLTHHHLDDGLAGAQIYELETRTGQGGAPWQYSWRGPAI